MKAIIAYAVALALALFNGKLVAGAISGIILSPLSALFDRLTFISRYLIPYLQGIAMGFVGVCTAKWVLSAFSLGMGWPMVALIVLGYAVILLHLLKNEEERHFHLSAGLGELLGIFLGGCYFLIGTATIL